MSNKERQRQDVDLEQYTFNFVELNRINTIFFLLTGCQDYHWERTQAHFLVRG